MTEPTVAIDARLWGIKHTGPGRYTENLVRQLLRLGPKLNFHLLVSREDAKEIAAQFEKIPSTPIGARHYSVSEQLLLPLVLLKVRPKLLHVPHFNIPLFWPGKLVVTIHDLITHQFRGQDETTLPLPIYWVKYVVHRLLMRVAVKRASAVIVPTQWVKSQVVETYHLDKNKVFSTPEGVSPLFFAKPPTPQKEYLREKYHLPEVYLIYTGNAYKHKNLERLLQAIKEANINLVFVCSRSVFRSRFEEKVKKANAQSLIYFLGQVPDSDLRELYRFSLGFITASLSEGFGLPALEAMAAGTVVLSSNAACLPEVYGKVPLYFNPLNVAEIVSSISLLKNLKPSERQDKITQGQKHAALFTWQKTARLTLAAYEYALKH